MAVFCSFRLDAYFLTIIAGIENTDRVASHFSNVGVHVIKSKTSHAKLREYRYHRFKNDFCNSTDSTREDTTCCIIYQQHMTKERDVNPISMRHLEFAQMWGLIDCS